MKLSDFYNFKLLLKDQKVEKSPNNSQFEAIFYIELYVFIKIKPMFI